MDTGIGIRNGFNWLREKEVEIKEQIKARKVESFNQKYKSLGIRVLNYRELTKLEKLGVVGFLEYFGPFLRNIPQNRIKLLVEMFISFAKNNINILYKSLNMDTNTKVLNNTSFFQEGKDTTLQFYDKNQYPHLSENINPGMIREIYSDSKNDSNINKELVTGICSELFWLVLFQEVIDVLGLSEYKVDLSDYRSNLEHVGLTENPKDGVDLIIAKAGTQEILPFQIKTTKKNQIYITTTLFSNLQGKYITTNLPEAIVQIADILFRSGVIDSSENLDINMVLKKINESPTLKLFLRFYDGLLRNDRFEI